MERYMVVLKSFKKMAPGLEQTLRENVHPLTLEKDGILQVPGTLNDVVYFIEQGVLHYFRLAGGRKATLGLRREDQFVLTLKQLLHPGKWSRKFGIEALEACKLWCIPGAIVRQLREKHLDFNFHYEQILVRDLVARESFIECSRPGAGSENLKSFRSDFPDLLNRVPIQYLASLTQIPENQLRHLLESPIKLHAGTTRRRRTHK